MIADRSRVLLHRADREEFWALPGGAAESGGSAFGALRPELTEQFDIEAQIGNQLFVGKCNFERAGQKYEVLGHYSKFRLTLDSSVREEVGPFEEREIGRRVRFAWFEQEKSKTGPAAEVFGLVPTLRAESLRISEKYASKRRTNLALHTDEFHRPARQNCEVSQRRRPVKPAGELGR